jgi:hypothetical protein
MLLVVVSQGACRGGAGQVVCAGIAACSIPHIHDMYTATVGAGLCALQGCNIGCYTQGIT